jgi:leader peptidase (prepilin peptidase)/N-methyltransferase
VNWIVALPLSVRLAAVFFLGVLVGTRVNQAIYALAWKPRPIGPWLPPHPQAPPRRWYDYLPLFGWMALRRESHLHGRGFWVRPFFVELSTGFGFAMLYAWEMPPQLGLYGWLPPSVPRPDALVPHAQFLLHAVLIGLMLAASIIDLDDKTIPDEITVPGTLAALLLAALLPAAHLPDGLERATLELAPLVITSPLRWPAWLSGAGGLAVGLAALLAWWYAILPKTWWTRGGLMKAIRYLAASIVRSRGLKGYLALLLAAAAGIIAAWFVGRDSWRALLTALVGMLCGGGIVWAVRIVGSRALGREAMGFGDVTLMAMIGAFLGWQPSILIFFLAPFAGLFIAMGQWLLTGRRDIAYGPYLCLAALVLIVAWSPIWHGWGRDMYWAVYAMGWFVPGVAVVALVLMSLMLWGWRRVSERFFARD